MGMEFRPYYLSREWVKKGHKVRIIAADFSHLRKTNPVVNSDFEIAIIDGIEYQWVRTARYESNGLSRARTMIEFCSKIYRRARNLSDSFHPDAVISSSTYPLDVFPANRIAKLSGAKYIHEIHDMWPITPKELYGMSRFNPFVVVMQIGENFFCKHADKVVSVLPCAKEYLMGRGMGKEKFESITNGINLNDWDNQEELNSNIKDRLIQAKNEGRFVLSFFGSHTRSYNLDCLLKALKNFEDRIFVAFVGSGNYKQELIDLAKSIDLSMDCYKFFNSINKSMIPSLIEESDASYVGAKRSLMFSFGIGMNKLFDAMMGGKPILYAVEAPNNYIEEFKCGVSVTPEDVDSLSVGIEKLMEMSVGEREELGKNGRDAVLKNFNYEVLADRFLKVMQE